jgi:hypothetical protein
VRSAVLQHHSSGSFGIPRRSLTRAPWITRATSISFASGEDAVENCVTISAERPTIDARLVGFSGRFRIDYAGLHRVLDRE